MEGCMCGINTTRNANTPTDLMQFSGCNRIINTNTMKLVWLSGLVRDPHEDLSDHLENIKILLKCINVSNTFLVSSQIA